MFSVEGRGRRSWVSLEMWARRFGAGISVVGNTFAASVEILASGVVVFAESGAAFVHGEAIGCGAPEARLPVLAAEVPYSGGVVG